MIVLSLRNDENKLLSTWKNNLDLSVPTNTILQIVLGYFKSLRVLRIPSIDIFP